MASNRGPQARPAPETQTQTATDPEQAAAPPAPILRLRGSHTSRRRVQWTEDVVDNEKLNRKKSKGMNSPLPQLIVCQKGEMERMLTAASLLHLPPP